MFRSLSPRYNPKYLGHYDGDASYHDGCVSAMTSRLLRTLLKNGIYKQRVRASLLVPIMHHAREAGIHGYVSKNLDGNAPFFPRGCVSQAWSVAEIAG